MLTRHLPGKNFSLVLINQYVFLFALIIVAVLTIADQGNTQPLRHPSHCSTSEQVLVFCPRQPCLPPNLRFRARTVPPSHRFSWGTQNYTQSSRYHRRYHPHLQYSERSKIKALEETRRDGRPRRKEHQYLYSS